MAPFPVAHEDVPRDEPGVRDLHPKKSASRLERREKNSAQQELHLYCRRPHYGSRNLQFKRTLQEELYRRGCMIIASETAYFNDIVLCSDHPFIDGRDTRKKGKATA